MDDRGTARPVSSTGAASAPSESSRRDADRLHAGMTGAGGADVGDAKLRILVADDEEGVLFALKEYLGCCGWEVDAALNPAEAQRLLETRDYAAVISRNPATGEEIQIKAKTVVKFRVAKACEDAILPSK